MSNVMPNTSARAPGTNLVHFALFLVATAIVIAFYWPTALGILSEWRGGSLYSHGWFCALLFLHFLWHSQREHAPVLQPQWFAILFVFGAGILWWIGSIASIAIFQVFSLYCIIVGLLWLVWGWRMLLSTKYMVLVLALALPLWQIFQHPLRVLSADVSYWFLVKIGIPVLRDDYTLVVPGGRFNVEPTCAGLSFLLAATSLVFIFAAWNRLRAPHVILMLAVSTFVAIFANWVRIIIIVVVGNYTNMQSPIVHSHLTFGWILFAALYCPVFWLMVRRYSTVESKSPEPVTVTQNIPKGWIGPALGVLVVVLFPVIHWWWGGAVNSSQESKLQQLHQLNGFKLSSGASAVSWKPHFEGVGVEGFRSISLKGGVATLYLAEYPYQTQEAELINVNNHFYEAERWLLEKREKTAEYEAIWLNKGEQRRLIVFTYVVADQRVIDEKRAKLLQLKGYFDRRFNAYALAVMLDQSSLSSILAPVQLADAVLSEAIARLRLTNDKRYPD